MFAYMKINSIKGKKPSITVIYPAHTKIIQLSRTTSQLITTTMTGKQANNR